MATRSKPAKEQEIRPGADVWRSLVHLAKTGELQSTSQDSTVIFVGPRQCGKTTLINRFLFPDKKDDAPKPTLGLEYLFSRRAARDGPAKDVAHIWEIGGGNSLSKLLEVTLTKENVANATVVIVTDLSKPSEVLPNMLFWLDAVKARCLEIDKETKALKQPIMDKLKERAARRFGETHPDNVNKEGDVGRGYIRHLGINVIVVTTNYDSFHETDPELKKIMTRTLRFVAHTQGVSLLATNHTDKQLLTNFRALLQSLAFRTGPVRAKSTDHLKPFLVPAGADAIQDIGPPPKQDVSNLSRNTTPLDLWRRVFESYFGAPPPLEENLDAAREVSIDPTGQFLESEVDSARAAKEEELVRYREEQAQTHTISARVPTRSSSSTASASEKERAPKPAA